MLYLHHCVVNFKHKESLIQIWNLLCLSNNLTEPLQHSVNNSQTVECNKQIRVFECKLRDKRHYV